jgi:hypothetical protein
VAVAPNGTAVYAQNAWRAAAGSVRITDPVGDELMKRHDLLQRNSQVNWLLVLFLIGLVVATLLGVADVAVPLAGAPVPDLFRRFWPHRRLLLLGLSAALAILLGFVVMTGFGLEAAAARAAEEAVPAVAAAEGTAEAHKRDLRRDLDVAAYALDRTTWLGLAIVAHLVALFAAGTTYWLDRHPAKPDPRVEVYC